MLQGTGITLPAVTGIQDSGKSIATAPSGVTPAPAAPATAPAGTPATAATTDSTGAYTVPAAPRPAPASPAPASPASTASTEQPAAPSNDAAAATTAQAAGTSTTGTSTPAASATPATTADSSAAAQAATTPAAPAALAPATELSISFDPSSADIPASAKAGLDALAAKLAADDSLRITVNSYASASAEPSDERESKARRMSLIRAINLRQYPFSKGVKATRIDIRALGSKTADVDRIDVVQAAAIQ